MVTSYSRSQIYQFNELNETQQKWVKETYFEEESDCQSDSYVILAANKDEPLPMGMFMRTERSNKFTHGIYSTSAFDGYFITFDRRNEYCTIAHKYF